MKKETTFDIEAYIKYFNLFEEKKAEISYEVVDGDLAMIDAVSGEILRNECRKNDSNSKRNRNR